MKDEINNILDGVKDLETEVSELRDEEAAIGYEDQEWTAEVTVDDLDGEEYVQITYDLGSVDAEEISRVAQSIGADEVEWGINWANHLDLLEPEMLITQKKDQGGVTSASSGPTQSEIEINEEVARELGFENETESWQKGKYWQGGDCLEQYQCDVFSRDQEVSYGELIGAIAGREASYFIKAGSDIAETADRKIDEDTEIQETAEINVKMGEQSSATVDVYMPMENDDDIENYSDVKVSDEYSSKAKEIIENLGSYSNTKDRDPEINERTPRLPNSEILTKIEREIGQGEQIRLQ